MKKLGIVAQFFRFVIKQKKFWLIPLIAVLVILGLLMVLGEGSVVAPLVYPF